MEWPAASALSRAGDLRPHEDASLYSIGDPTDAEQLYLEPINEVHADSAGTPITLTNITDPDILATYQFFSVDLSKFVADTQRFPVAWPLAFEPRLIRAAHGHSLWMLTHGIQAHNETDPAHPGKAITSADRITAVGYPWRTLGRMSRPSRRASPSATPDSRSTGASAPGQCSILRDTA